MINYHRSIKLALSQYMNNVSLANQMIHKNIDNIRFSGKTTRYWSGYNTWLHLIFNKSLFIFGLDLGESEVFIRWLLIERAKYYKLFLAQSHRGFYIMNEKEKNSSSIGKKFFLNSVGIHTFELPSYKDIYENIWL